LGSLHSQWLLLLFLVFVVYCLIFGFGLHQAVDIEMHSRRIVDHEAAFAPGLVMEFLHDSQTLALQAFIFLIDFNDLEGQNQAVAVEDSLTSRYGRLIA
jgi:hypothetical protein